MGAINLYRRRRMVRFGVFSAFFGAMLVIIGMVVLAGFGWLVGARFDVTLMDALWTGATNSLIAAVVFGIAGAIIGVTTARLTPRNSWAWRLFGSLIVAFSSGLWASTFSWATPTWVGWILMSAVCLAGIATGLLVISLAKAKATENL